MTTFPNTAQVKIKVGEEGIIQLSDIVIVYTIFPIEKSLHVGPDNFVALIRQLGEPIPNETLY